MCSVDPFVMMTAAVASDAMTREKQRQRREILTKDTGPRYATKVTGEIPEQIEGDVVTRPSKWWRW